MKLPKTHCLFCTIRQPVTKLRMVVLHKLCLLSCLAGQHQDFPHLLAVAWSSLLKAIEVQAFAGLSQSCVRDLLLQPLAAALRHQSTALHDPAEEFWSSSGIQGALQGCDLGLVEAALAESGSQLSHAGFSGVKLHQQAGLKVALSCCVVFPVVIITIYRYCSQC